MDIGEIKVRVTADLSEFKTGLAEGEKVAQNFEQKVTRTSSRGQYDLDALARAGKRTTEELQAGMKLTGDAAQKASESIKGLAQAQASSQTSASAAADAATGLSQSHLSLMGALSKAITLTQSHSKAQWGDVEAAKAHNGVMNAVVAAMNKVAAGQVETGHTAEMSATRVRMLGLHLFNMGQAALSGQLGLRGLVQHMSYLLLSSGHLLGGISAVGIALGGVAAAALVVVAALARLVILGIRFQQQQAALAVAINATNNAMKMSATQAQALVIEVGKLPRATQQGAQAAFLELAKNPLINGTMFRDLMKIVPDLAAAMGTDMPQAAKALADSFDDPVAAVMKLSNQYQALSWQQVKAAQDAVLAGDKMKAATIAVEGFKTVAQRAADTEIPAFDKAVKDLSNSWTTLLAAMSTSAPILFLIGKMTELLGLLREIVNLDFTNIFKLLTFLANPVGSALGEALGPRLAGKGGPPLSWYQDQIKDLQRQITAGEQGFLGTGMFKKSPEELAKMRHELEVLKQRAVEAAVAANKVLTPPPPPTSADVMGSVSTNTAEANQQLNAAVANLNVVNEIQRRKLALDTQIANMAKLEADARQKGDLDTAEAAKQAIKALEAQRDVTRTAAEEAQRDIEIRTKALKLFGPELSKFLEFEREYDALRAKGVGAEQARDLAMKKANLAYAEAAKSGNAAYAALSKEAQAALAVADAWLKGADAIAIYTKELKAAEIAAAQGQNLGGTPRQYALLQLQKKSAESIEQTAERINAMNKEAAAMERIAAAEAQSTVYGAQVERHEKIMTEMSKLRALALASENTELVRRIDKLIPELIAADDRLAAAEAKRQAIQFNRANDPNEAFKDQIATLKMLADTGNLTATALRNGLENAYIQLGRASESWLDGAVAGLLEYARQARNVGQEVAQALVQGLGAATDAITKLFLGMSVNIKSVIADLKYQIVRIFVQQTITAPIASWLASFLSPLGIGGGVSPVGGLGGLGGLAGGLGGGRVISVGGIPYVPATGGGGLGGLLGGSFGIPSPGSITSFLSQPLFGAGGLFGPGLAGSVASSFAGGAGSLGAFAGSSALAGAGSLSGVLGGLFGIGSGIMGLASGNPIGGISGILGGGLGLAGGLGLLGSWAGPAGMAIGLIGGLLGGLFKKKPKTPQEVTDIVFNGTEFTSSLSYSRGKSLGTTGPASNALIDAMNELFLSYGLTAQQGFPSGWILNSIGKNTGNQYIVGTGTYGSFTQWPGGKPGETNVAGIGSAEDAINILAAALIKSGAAGGTLTGLTATQKQALSYADFKSIDDIKAALDFSKVWDKMVDGARKVTQAEQAMDQLNEQFDALKVNATKYGFDLALLESRRTEEQRKIVTDFNEQVRLALLAANDNPAYQREVLGTSQDARMREAEYLNQLFPGLVNFANLIELNNKELAALEESLAQAADSIRTSLQAALDRLRYGSDISPYTIAQRYQMAYSEYTGLESQALAGQTIDYDRLTQVADTLLQYARVRFSVTEDYAVLAQRVEDLYTYLIGRPSYAEGGPTSRDWAWVGERGKELALFSQPANIVSAGQSADLTGNISRLVDINRVQTGINADMAKELRALRAEVRDMRRDNTNQNTWQKTRGVVAAKAS